MTMDKIKFGSIMAWLARLYPRFTLAKDTIASYYDVLGDLDADVLWAAVQECGATSKFFPTAAELRNAVFGLQERAVGLPAEGEAWDEVLRRVNVYDAPGPDEFAHPLVYQALQGIGGNRVLAMTSESQLMATRAHYFKVYRTLRAREREHAAMLPDVRRVVEALTVKRREQLPERV